MLKSFYQFTLIIIIFFGCKLQLFSQNEIPMPIIHEDHDSVSTYWEEYGEEIDNFDFIYNNGKTKNYDEILVENLMEEAQSHIGTPYRYGSKGPKTFDCSGFTSYVFKRQYNVFIGASSREQYARNEPIERSELQRGDLVFFTGTRSRKGVGHVGIVVEVDSTGNGFTFIHASSRNGVIINKSTDGYYTRRYVGARRVFGL